MPIGSCRLQRSAVTDGSSRLAERAAELRAAFDRTFAEPARLDESVSEDLLAVHAGSEAYAIRLTEIGGVFADKKITPVPGRASSFIGVAGFRGAIVPVHSLSSLLGHAADGTPRWLMLAASLPVAFAFDQFDGHLRVAGDAIVACGLGERAATCVTEFVRLPGLIRPIVNLHMALDAIGSAKLDAAPIKER